MTNRAACRVLVLGGNFSGVYVALQLEALAPRLPGLAITLVSVDHYLSSTRPFYHGSARHDAQPTGGPVRLRQHLSKVSWIDAEAKSIDLVSSRVTVVPSRGHDQREFEYDHLVIATGDNEPFRVRADVDARALILHSAADVMRLHTRVGALLDHAQEEPDPAQRRALLTFVVGGSGIGSMEIACTLHAFVRDTLASRHPALRREEVRVVLVHPQEAILPEIGDRLLADRQENLSWPRVEVRLGERVRACAPGHVDLEGGNSIPSFTLVWTGSVVPGKLTENLPCAKRCGRLLVDDHFALPGHPNVWAVGEGVLPPDDDAGNSRPPLTAQETLRQGKVVARHLAATLRAELPPSYSRFGPELDH